MEINIPESEIVDSAVEMVNDLRAEIDRLNMEAVTNSINFELLKVHLRLQLEETEGRFERTNEFDSPEACNDYIKAARFMSENFGRKDNMIKEAKHWYDNYSLPFKS